MSQREIKKINNLSREHFHNFTICPIEINKNAIDHFN